MSKPNLLLTLDAFGTLFRPKAPVVQQYGQVARQLGLSGFHDDDLEASLLRAIKAEAKQHPNYGKATGLGATRWWTNVIHNTFTPFLKHGDPLPPDLAPRLIHRFSSQQAYTTEPDLTSSLRAVRHHALPARRAFANILVGVVTNSDDRVPSILSSFGLSVSPLRYGTASAAAAAAAADLSAIAAPPAPTDPSDSASPVTDPNNGRGSTRTDGVSASVSASVPPSSDTNDGAKTCPAPHDIDFHCISYDVGFEKPDIRMFRAAEHMLAQILASQDAQGISTTPPPPPLDDPFNAGRAVPPETWQKVHVGDEFSKDVQGAINAGWRAVLVDGDGDGDGDAVDSAGRGREPGKEVLPWLEEREDARTLGELFGADRAVRVRSLQSLMRWLAGR